MTIKTSNPNFFMNAYLIQINEKVFTIESTCANNIKVILSSVLPAYDYPWRPGLEPWKKIAALNEMIKTYSEKNGFLYLDYYSSMVDDRGGMINDYTYDGVHPNEAGYDVMEPLVEKAIEKVLND